MDDSLASGVVLVADVESSTLIVASATGPQLVRYDDNDQFTVTDSNATPVALTDALITRAEFERYLAGDGAGGTDRNDTVVVSSYDATDSGDVARFALTVQPPSS